MIGVDPVSRVLAEVIHEASSVTAGSVADYIPELASADPKRFGLAAVSVLGRRYAAGDADVPFTIQSISKPFVYALVLAELGLDEVARYVGFEPTGEAFNAISLEEDTGRPANSMINAGAIVTTALVPGADADEQFERVLTMLSAFAGRALRVDERVYRSELDTGDRNRALGYLMAAAGNLPRSVGEATEVYFRQCAVEVTAMDLAVMGATLANAGVNPCTGDTVVDERVARQTLSLMASCGMYDYAGEWLLRVGLPAKSGVGGGIVAVQPAEFGLGVFSPPLDERGNSARGVAALTMLSEGFGLHLLAHPLEPRPPVERTDRLDGGAVVVHLRGEVDFLAAEQIAHHLADLAQAEPRPPAMRVDLTGVTRLRSAGERLIAMAVAACERSGIAVTVHDPESVVQGEAASDGSVLRPEHPGS